MPEFDFKGKQHIYAHHLTVPFRTLVPDSLKSMHSKNKEINESENLIIQGDNLDALKSLLPRYTGQIKCIYIDPPYNTGNENWTYNDRVNSPLMQEWFAQYSPVDNEDLQRHDKWLCMMWPRLQLLRELLADDGLIFISIDDNEQHHLRMIMDEIFGEKNFLANIVWQHRYGRSNNAKLFSNQREHIIVFKKSDKLTHIRVKRDELLNQTYSNPDNDTRGRWISSSYVNPATKEERPNLVYTITNPNSGKKVNHQTHAWKYSKETYKLHVKERRLWWGIHGKNKYPRLKNYLTESEEKGIVPIDLMLAKFAGTTDDGTKDLKSIFKNNEDGFNFKNPKPKKLIENLISIAEGGSSGRHGIILDSFAGSGTTAHAVLALNKRDDGNRKFIVIECEDYADSITAERVRRVATGVSDAKDKFLRQGLGGSFTYCTLGDPIEIEGMLSGDSLPSFPDLATYLHYTATGKSLGECDIKQIRPDGLFYQDELNDYYLMYEPDLRYLQSNEAILNEKRADRISNATSTNKNAVVFAVGKYIGQRTLTEKRITFCQLPYELHRKI